MNDFSHTVLQTGFLLGIFSRRARIYCYAIFYCYVNFSIVFGPNLGQKYLKRKTASWGGGGGGSACPQWKKASKKNRQGKLSYIILAQLTNIQYYQLLHQYHKILAVCQFKGE